MEFRFRTFFYFLEVHFHIPSRIRTILKQLRGDDLLFSLKVRAAPVGRCMDFSRFPVIEECRNHVFLQVSVGMPPRKTHQVGGKAVPAEVGCFPNIQFELSVRSLFPEPLINRLTEFSTAEIMLSMGADKELFGFQGFPSGSWIFRRIQLAFKQFRNLFRMQT